VLNLGYEAKGTHEEEAMWLIVASGNGAPGIDRAAQMLCDGGAALDAVEAAARLVESNAQDDSVGLGGLPNVLGQVELDASIMDGRTLAAGAVGALKGFEHPISVARCVMERSAHVLLVGEGAARFAGEMGFAPCELLTGDARRMWQGTLEPFVSAEDMDHMAERRKLLPVVQQLMQTRLQHGTVNFLARDRHGNIASAVSTSGWPCKYPGRLGDSPIIGAGNYADNRYGAAACTHYGELAIRCGTARSVLLYMKMGMTVEGACQEAMRDLQPLLVVHGGAMTIVAMDSEGHPFGITSRAEEEPYLVMTGQSDGLQTVEHLHASIG
jgi:beta-aspartyl-peptidase (threonine type)